MPQLLGPPFFATGHLFNSTSLFVTAKVLYMFEKCQHAGNALLADLRSWTLFFSF